MDLSRTDFSGKDLSNSNFEKSLNFGSNFRLVDLKNANFEDANLYGAYFFKADLSNKDLSYTNLEGTDLRGVNLTGANLTGSHFKNTKLANSNINDVIYENIEFLIFEHSYQNSIESISQSPGYIQRATIKIIDKYFLNSI